MPDDQYSTGNNASSPTEEGYSSQQEQISLDDVHRLLASERRRLILSYLITRPNEPVPRDDLIDVVVENEYPDPGPATHRVRVESDVHHVHLPNLADAGVLDYDPVAETVQYTGSERIETLLASSNKTEGPPK